MVMKAMKWSVLLLAVVVVLALGAHQLLAADAKTITGTASCGGCTGVVKGCCLMLTDSDGARWVLRGKKDVLDSSFGDRKSGKTMTATLAGKPVTKKGKDGKEYKEVKVSEVKENS